MPRAMSAHRVWLVVALGLAALTPAPTQALPAPPSPMGLAFQHSLRGAGQALAGAGDFLYVSQGGDLAVLDLSTPARPQQVGSLALDGEITDLAVSGSTLLAMVWPRTAPRFTLAPHIETLSLADPAAPQPTGTLSIATPTAWSIDGDTVYVGSATGDTTVVRPGPTPGTPTIAAYATSINGFHFIAHGSHLFAVDSITNTLVVSVFDAAPGAHLQRLSQANIPTPTIYNVPPPIAAMALLGDLLLVTTTDRYAIGVTAIDISDPLVPKKASGGTIALVTSRAGDQAGLLTTLPGPYSNRQQAQIWSVADPVKPTLLHAFDVPRSTAGQIIGHRFYFTGPQHLSFIDLTAAQPTVQTIDLRSGAADWDVVGDRLYTAESSGDSLAPSVFTILDVADPAQPVVVASFPEASPLGLAVDEPHAVTAGSSSWTLYDVGVTTPTVAYSTTTASPIRDLALDGDTLALLQPDATRVYDLAPATPALIATVPVTGTNVALSGSLLWVYNGETGNARSIDLTMPGTPVISDAAEFGPHAFAGDGVATGDLFLLGMLGGELVVVEDQASGTPSAVILDLTKWAGPSNILSLDVKGSEVLVGLSSGHCMGVDISAPGAPAPTWIAPVANRPCDARWDGADLILGPNAWADFQGAFDSFNLFPLPERVWLPSIKVLNP